MDFRKGADAKRCIAVLPKKGHDDFPRFKFELMWSPVTRKEIADGLKRQEQAAAKQAAAAAAKAAAKETADAHEDAKSDATDDLFESSSDSDAAKPTPGLDLDSQEIDNLADKPERAEKQKDQFLKNLLRSSSKSSMKSITSISTFQTAFAAYMASSQESGASLRGLSQSDAASESKLRSDIFQSFLQDILPHQTRLEHADQEAIEYLLDIAPAPMLLDLWCG